MTRQEKVLLAYNSGALSVSTAQFEVALAITKENVDAVMAALPHEIVTGLRGWTTDEPSAMVGDNLSPDAEREIQAHSKE